MIRKLGRPWRRYDEDSMTIEERVESLTQSIESHDRQLGELAERMDNLSERLNSLAEHVDATNASLDRFISVTQRNFDRLTTAMMGLTDHIVNHERRIQALEN